MDADERKLLEFRRTIRDPIYDYIPLTDLECFLIDTSAFQRLDRIKQMHAFYKVYPSARYSRKTHSIGAMHLSGKAIARILYLQDPDLATLVPAPAFTGGNSTKDYREDLDNLAYLRDLRELYTEHGENFIDALEVTSTDDTETDPVDIIESAAWLIQAVRILGLLHDAGHGPFSHLLEEIQAENGGEEAEFDHNRVTPDVIDRIQAQAEDNIRDKYNARMIDLTDSILGFVKTILRERENLATVNLQFIYQLTDFPFDCDMLDYLVRDAYFAGTPEYGKIDANRIVKRLAVKEGDIVLSRHAMTAISDALDSYFKMYKVVYKHRTVDMYDILLKEALEEVSEFVRDITVIEEEKDLDRFLMYDDRKLLSEIELRAENRISPEEDYSECNFNQSWEYISNFQNRKKPYDELLFGTYFINGSQIIDTSELKDNIHKAISESEDELEIDLPYHSIYDLKRGGVGIEELVTWIQKDIIFNPDSGGFSPLFAENPEIARQLSHMELPVRLFVRNKPGISEEKRDEAEATVEDRLQEVANQFRGVEFRCH